MKLKLVCRFLRNSAFIVIFVLKGYVRCKQHLVNDVKSSPLARSEPLRSMVGAHYVVLRFSVHAFYFSFCDADGHGPAVQAVIAELV